MYQSILGLSTKLLHAYWVSGSAGPALVAEDHGQGHMSLIVRQPKPVLGVNLLLSGIVFFMVDYKRVRHAFSENAG